MPGNSATIPQRLLLFDGVCNLCDRSVQFVIRHDRKGKFKFASLQSAYAEQILKKYPEIAPFNKTGNNPDWGSIVFILKGKAYTRSAAVLKVMEELGFPWKIAAVFYILPSAFRNALYNFIAKNRYHWYGKKDSCMIPTPELRDRFMD